MSDLIYGLSLSIGAISLVITNSQESSVSDINKNILSFLFVFLILITSWIIYTGDMSVLPVETRLVVFLNVVLLVFVAVTPYLFDQIMSPYNNLDVQGYASILFTLVYAGTLSIMTIFAHIIAQEERQLVDLDTMVRFRRSRNILFFLMGIVLLSLAAPWAWTLVGVRVRMIAWFIPIAMFWFNRMRQAPAKGSDVTQQ